MKRGQTGRYEITYTAGEQIKAFIPHPLPPTPSLDLASMQASLEDAQLALGRLDSLTTLLPDPYLLLYTYVRKEAVLSSQIEGTQSSLSDLLMFELQEKPGVPVDDVTEVSNYVAAMEHGLRRLRGGFPLSNRLIREIHSELMASGRGSDKSPGEFRLSQNWIGGSRPGNAHFVPPPPHAVQDCMSDLERFLHAEDNALSATVRAALMHVQFETIHPFLDGNGRTGRLMITFLLCHKGVLQEPLLYLSLYIKQHRDEYYALLDGVRQNGDWEAWIEFFLKGVKQTADSAVSTAQRLVTLFRDDQELIQETGRAAGSALRAQQVLKERPITSIPQVCELSGLSFPAASSAMGKLVELGITREITGRLRNRLYVYDSYLAILNEGTEAM